MIARPKASFASSSSVVSALCAALAAASLAPGCGDDHAPATSSTSSGSGSSSSSSGAPPALCAEGSVGLQGSLAGADVAASYPTLRTRAKGPVWQAFFQSQGHVALFGDKPLEVAGSSASATGVFRMPEEGPSAGEWFCAGGGSSVSIDTEKKFKLASLSRLGACPDETVAGEIDGCFGPDIGLCPKGTKLTSTIAGAEFDWTTSVTGWGGMPGLYEIYLDNGGVLAMYIELDTVLGGLLYIAKGSPDEGALYCMHGGSLSPGGQSAMKFTLSGLSRLGTCADAEAAAGALDGCAQ